MLHLCTHLDQNRQGLSKKAIAEFSSSLENDGITRLDLLWNMTSYKKWFDAPDTFLNELVAA
jgi:hypothetical protein